MPAWSAERPLPRPTAPARSWRLEVLGQYRANIAVQSRRHVALPGRSLEFRRRFFRSFPPSLGGFDSLPRPSCDRAGDGSHDLGSWGWIAGDHFNDPWRCGANVMGSPRGQLASSLTLRREGSHVALAQDVAFSRPLCPKLSRIDVVVYRLGGDAQYVCGFSNRHDLDTPLLRDEFASLPFAQITRRRYRHGSVCLGRSRTPCTRLRDLRRLFVSLYAAL